MKTSSDLPENTVVVFVSGGVVQWAARGPGRHIDLIVVDADKSDFVEEGELPYNIWDEPCETGVEFDPEIGDAIQKHIEENWIIKLGPRPEDE